MDISLKSYTRFKEIPSYTIPKNGDFKNWEVLIKNFLKVYPPLAGDYPQGRAIGELLGLKLHDLRRFFNELRCVFYLKFFYQVFAVRYSGVVANVKYIRNLF